MPDEVTPLEMPVTKPEIIKTPFSIKWGAETKDKPGTKEGIILCSGNFSGFQFSP